MPLPTATPRLSQPQQIRSLVCGMSESHSQIFLPVLASRAKMSSLPVGIMYIPTGNDDIFALDAKTGKKIWEWDSDIPQTNDLICCGWDNRGVAVGNGMVYSG